MRAIEFRAWYIDEEVMAYSDDDAEFDVAYWDGANCSRIAMLNHLCRRPLNMILMQYTGLQDAKGNKVFEGDILESHMGDLVVTFTNGKFIAEMKDKQPGKWDYHIEGRLFYQVDVIGNIYEELNEQKTANIGTDRDG